MIKVQVHDEHFTIAMYPEYVPFVSLYVDTAT